MYLSSAAVDSFDNSVSSLPSTALVYDWARSAFIAHMYGPFSSLGQFLHSATIRLVAQGPQFFVPPCRFQGRGEAQDGTGRHYQKGPPSPINIQSASGPELDGLLLAALLVDILLHTGLIGPQQLPPPKTVVNATGSRVYERAFGHSRRPRRLQRTDSHHLMHRQ